MCLYSLDTVAEILVITLENCIRIVFIFDNFHILTYVYNLDNNKEKVIHVKGVLCPLFNLVGHL
jgi:hypothetical protein